MNTPTKIQSFHGPYRFLSNFWESPVEFDGLEYPTVEHAYQAAKTLNELERAMIRVSDDPSKAKKLGQKVTLRKDWDSIKDEVMAELISKKFNNDQNNLDELLLATGDADLVEGNNWGDTYWGVCNGEGYNKLGEILMTVRDTLRVLGTA